jgi:hypothetical protein
MRNLLRKTDYGSSSVVTNTLGNRLFFYGPPKIGLTTFAQGFSNVEFVCFNNPHLSQLKVPGVNVETMDEFRIWIKDAYNNPTRSTYVFDNFDGFQDVLAADIALKANIPNINCLEYGSGFFDAIILFKKILKTLDRLVTKGHSLVFLGHSTTIPYKTFAFPDIIRHIPDCYIKNHKLEDVATLLCNWVDGIFYVNHYEESNKAISQDPWCWVSSSPFHLAGNRFNIKLIMELDARIIENTIKQNRTYKWI